MYKIIETDERRYPHVLLLLLNITTGEKRWWCFGEVHADDLCEEYHVKNLQGVILDNLPVNGGWIERSEINKL